MERKEETAIRGKLIAPNSDKLINLTLSPSRSCTCPSPVSAKAAVELNMHVVLREGCPVSPGSLRNLALSWALLLPFQEATTMEEGGYGRCYQWDRFREDLRSLSSAFLHCVLLMLPLVPLTLSQKPAGRGTRVAGWLSI